MKFSPVHIQILKFLRDSGPKFYAETFTPVKELEKAGHVVKKSDSLTSRYHITESGRKAVAQIR